MEKINPPKKPFSPWFYRFWSDMTTQVKKNPKKRLFYGLFYVLFLGAFFYLLLFFRTSIRQLQIDTLIFQQNEVKSLEPISYNQLDSTVKSTKAISVLLANPATENYQKMISILNEQEKELNRKIYFYPLIYTNTVLFEQYQINPDEVTFIFFEGGIEKNRLVFDALEQAKTTFIPELNRLPMWNLKNDVETNKNSD